MRAGTVPPKRDEGAAALRMRVRVLDVGLPFSCPGPLMYMVVPAEAGAIACPMPRTGNRPPCRFQVNFYHWNPGMYACKLPAPT
jgi:hypothetical protein